MYALVTGASSGIGYEISKLLANTDFDLKSISAERCAKEAVTGLFKKKPLVIPANDIKLLRIASKFAALRLTLPIEYKIQTNKTKRKHVNR